MKLSLLSAASAIALASIPSPVLAQMSMPGMTMPMKAKSAPKHGTTKNLASKAKAKPAASNKATSSRARHANPARMSMPINHNPMSVPAQSSQGVRSQSPVDQSKMMNGMVMPARPQSGAQGSVSMPGDHRQMGQMGEMPMKEMHGSHAMNMKAALGSYPAQRESSGTAWQPDSSTAMGGAMLMSGDWSLMAHGTLNLVYDHQSGPRGDGKAFASGMLMGMAQRSLGKGTLQLRAMLSPDPTMGPSGYPLLLASGETANGRDRLIDRQHPHDFFMELSASVSQEIGSKSSAFLYAGLPGEPAFGPPSFMHRESIMDSPEAPITHHWLDSTHITFGVVTAGLVLDQVKIEASRFNGREPDERRWNIETGPLDSSSVRVSFNPTRTLSLQGSWAHLVDPEQLEPGVNQTRWSASALWADDIAPDWHAAVTLAWGRKSSLGHDDDGYVAEASVRHSGWTVFGRGEMVQNRELIQGHDEPAYRVGKISLGAVRDFGIADHLSIGAGGLFSVNFVPDALTSVYGGNNPTGAMGFVRLKLN